jgi:hypothetical protein
MPEAPVDRPLTRLDAFIARMMAQRAILNLLADARMLPEGDILELGLGNGRTYSHLCARFPARRIIAFDRAVAAHGTSIPPEGDVVLGDIAQSAQAFVGRGAALVHADIGTGYDAKDAVTLEWLPDLVAGLLVPGGYAASGLRMRHAALEPLDLPPEAVGSQYGLYRKRG